MGIQLLRRHRLSRGQALVEFALVLPVLLILTMLIIQYGIIFYTTLSLTNLSREGARFAATQPASSDEDILDNQQDAIKSRMRNVIPSNIKWSDIRNQIDITYLDTDSGDTIDTPNPGSLVEVEITYNMSNKLFLPSTFMGIQIFSTSYTTFTKMMIES